MSKHVHVFVCACVSVLFVCRVCMYVCVCVCVCSALNQNDLFPILPSITARTVTLFNFSKRWKKNSQRLLLSSGGSASSRPGLKNWKKTSPTSLYK